MLCHTVYSMQFLPISCGFLTRRGTCLLYGTSRCSHLWKGQWLMCKIWRHILVSVKGIPKPFPVLDWSIQPVLVESVKLYNLTTDQPHCYLLLRGLMMDMPNVFPYRCHCNVFTGSFMCRCLFHDRYKNELEKKDKEKLARLLDHQKHYLVRSSNFTISMSCLHEFQNNAHLTGIRFAAVSLHRSLQRSGGNFGVAPTGAKRRLIWRYISFDNLHHSFPIFCLAC